MSRTNPLLIGLLAVTLATPALAQGEVCEQPREVDRYQLLRRLSLDLRGEVPTYDEYLALDRVGDVPQETVRALIRSDAFRLEMRRFHEAFLWPNVSKVSIADNAYTINTNGGGGAWARPNTTWARNQRANPALPFITCADRQQTEFDPAFPGEFRPIVPEVRVEGTVNGTARVEMQRQEGWREVEPYWAPGTRVKVCAWDAQETREVMVGTTLRKCSDRTGVNQVACGCGPNLRWCMPNNGALVMNPVRESFREQLALSVDEVTTGAAPYTQLLLSKRTWENGAIATYANHFGETTAPNAIYLAPDPENPRKERAFTDETWVERDRGGVHAGILTLPGYLLRFQTQRGRANRLLESFACEPFVAPADLIPRPGCSKDSNDLTERCFCQSCHSALEPTASAWGLFSETGTTMMTDPTRFPAEDPTCIGKGDAFCRKFYVTDRKDPAAGKHIAYQFALTHPDWPAIVQKGPGGAAQLLINDGTLARCTVKRAFARLMKRDILAEGRDAPERDLLQQLAGEFEASDYDFPALIERLVTLPEYRRVR